MISRGPSINSTNSGVYLRSGLCWGPDAKSSVTVKAGGFFQLGSLLAQKPCDPSKSIPLFVICLPIKRPGAVPPPSPASVHESSEASDDNSKFLSELEQESTPKGQAHHGFPPSGAHDLRAAREEIPHFATEMLEIHGRKRSTHVVGERRPVFGRKDQK